MQSERNNAAAWTPHLGAINGSERFASLGKFHARLALTNDQWHNSLAQLPKNASENNYLRMARLLHT